MGRYVIATFSIFDSGSADTSEVEGMLTAMTVIIFPAEIVANLVFAVLAYQLVKRQNDHFARERELREGIVNMIRAAAGSPEREGLLAQELTSMWFVHQAKEKEHNSLLWGVVIALPTAFMALAWALMWAIVMRHTEDAVGAILIALGVLVVVELVFTILCSTCSISWGRTCTSMMAAGTPSCIRRGWRCRNWGSREEGLTGSRGCPRDRS
ncbi:MAG: hypothetical protein ACUVT7_06845 [Thermoplasmata archaeon]